MDVHRRPPVDGRPNYALRRLVAAALAVVFLLAIAAGAMSLSGLGGRPASASETGSATAETPGYTERQLVAQPGDTLWSIAEAHHGDADLVAYVDRLIDLNGGTTVLAGQAVRLP